MTIKDMKPGDQAVVKGYESGNNLFLQRLLALGLTKGTSLKMVKRAPLGDPAEIEVRGFRLSLRKEEASVLQLAQI